MEVEKVTRKTAKELKQARRRKYAAFQQQAPTNPTKRINGLRRLVKRLPPKVLKRRKSKLERRKEKRNNVELLQEQEG